MKKSKRLHFVPKLGWRSEIFFYRAESLLLAVFIEHVNVTIYGHRAFICLSEALWHGNANDWKFIIAVVREFHKFLSLAIGRREISNRDERKPKTIYTQSKSIAIVKAQWFITTLFFVVDSLTDCFKSQNYIFSCHNGSTKAHTSFQQIFYALIDS